MGAGIDRRKTEQTHEQRYADDSQVMNSVLPPRRAQDATRQYYVRSRHRRTLRSATSADQAWNALRLPDSGRPTVRLARGADLWHVASALYVAPSPADLYFLTLDERQRSVAATLGFRI